MKTAPVAGRSTLIRNFTDVVLMVTYTVALIPVTVRSAQTRFVIAISSRVQRVALIFVLTTE